MILFPHAKINLGLDITGKLPNGFHTLETIMVHTDWEDVLELTPAEHTELICTGLPIDCPPEKNLVMKAFRLMEAETGGLPPTRIQLHKNIPDGAGLGGGSADAAFCLRGLNELYNLGFPPEKLAEMAAMLGSDCPFFIYDCPMLCSGTGTVLTPMPELASVLSGYQIVIVRPPFGVSTKEAYSGVRPYQGSRPALTERIKAPVSAWQGSVGNDFEPSVGLAHPQIEDIKARLRELGAAYVQMSGSGSAVFGLFPEPIDADILAERLPDCFIHAAK